MRAVGCHQNRDSRERRFGQDFCVIVFLQGKDFVRLNESDEILRVGALDARPTELDAAAPLIEAGPLHTYLIASATKPSHRTRDGVAG